MQQAEEPQLPSEDEDMEVQEEEKATGEQDLWEAAFAAEEDVAMTLEEKIHRISKVDPEIAVWAAKLAKSDRILGGVSGETCLGCWGTCARQSRRLPRPGRGLPRVRWHRACSS